MAREGPPLAAFMRAIDHAMANLKTTYGNNADGALCRSLSSPQGGPGDQLLVGRRFMNRSEPSSHRFTHVFNLTARGGDKAPWYQEYLPDGCDLRYSYALQDTYHGTAHSGPEGDDGQKERGKAKASQLQKFRAVIDEVVSAVRSGPKSLVFVHDDNGSGSALVVATVAWFILTDDPDADLGQLDEPESDVDKALLAALLKSVQESIEWALKHQAKRKDTPAEDAWD
jgi:hypothetical protein